jgi:hypothetical protein
VSTHFWIESMLKSKSAQCAHDPPMGLHGTMPVPAPALATGEYAAAITAGKASRKALGMVAARADEGLTFRESLS